MSEELVKALEWIIEEHADNQSPAMNIPDADYARLIIRRIHNKAKQALAEHKAKPIENDLRASLIEAIGLYQGWEESAIAMVDECILPVLNKQNILKPALSEEELVGKITKEFQKLWDDYLLDTGYYPPCFEVYRGKMTAILDNSDFGDKLAEAALSVIAPHYEAQIAELKAQIPQWNDISTAPKDGTRIFLNHPNWSQDEAPDIGCWDGQYWYCDNISYDADEPSVWMHLPKPPAEDQSDE